MTNAMPNAVMVLAVVLLFLACCGANAEDAPKTYKFYKGRDAPGVVLKVVQTAAGDPAALAAECDATPPCVAFNTKGELKAGVADGIVGELTPLVGATDPAQAGVYIQRRPLKYLGGAVPIRVSDASNLAKLQEESLVHIAAVTAMYDITKQAQQQQATPSTTTTTTTTTTTPANKQAGAATKAAFSTTTAATSVTQPVGGGVGGLSTPVVTQLTPSGLATQFKFNTSLLIKTVYTREQLTTLTRRSITSLLATKPSLSSLLRNSTFLNQRVTDTVLKWIDVYASFSWDSRYSPSVNWVGPVQNQGSCGSCTAFATVAVGEVARAAAIKRAGVHELSEQFLFFCNHVPAHNRTCQMGMLAGPAAQEVVSYGLKWSDCYPYNSYQGQAACAAPSPSCSGLRGGTGTVGKFSMLTFTDPFTIKDHIRKHGAVVTSFYTNGRLNSYDGGIILNTGAINTKSGHSVAVIGWNDLDQYWIAKNSWGTWWGESGFFRISYDDPMVCKDGDFGPPVGLTYQPTYLETRPWLQPVIKTPIKLNPVLIG